MDGVVIERGGHHGPEIVDSVDGGEVDDRADDRLDVRHRVVPAVLLAMTAREPSEERGVGGEMPSPGFLERRR